MPLSSLFRQLVVDLTPQYGAGEAASVARILFEDALNWKQGQPEREPDAEEQARFEGFSKRLLAGEPLQYVLGQADFFGLKFDVSPAVLIPRQETEELVDWVLASLARQAEPHPRVLDIGLGSGCIGITLKKKFPALQLYGLEKSAEALAMATQNAGRLLGSHAASVDFRQGDILNRNEWMAFPELEIVVSNPPYIPQQERAIVPPHVADHEPALALFVNGDDPLLFYRVIADFCREKLAGGGTIFFECNEFNARAVVDLLRAKGFQELTLKQDLCGADRMVSGVKTNA